VRLSNALQQGIFMSEVHIEEHSSPIKTPKQLIIVVLLSFLVPIVLIVMLSQLITTGVTPGKDSQGGASDEVIAARIKPIGQVEVTDPNAPKVEKTGKEIVDAVCSACHATGALNAPKIGDKAAWAPHLGEGLGHLTQNAIKGVRQMPPRGGNPDLSDLEIERAVAYMANQSGANFKEPAAKPAPAATDAKAKAK
jgi:cytochrome c5